MFIIYIKNSKKIIITGIIKSRVEIVKKNNIIVHAFIVKLKYLKELEV